MPFQQQSPNKATQSAQTDIHHNELLHQNPHPPTVINHYPYSTSPYVHTQPTIQQHIKNYNLNPQEQQLRQRIEQLENLIHDQQNKVSSHELQEVKQAVNSLKQSLHDLTVGQHQNNQYAHPPVINVLPSSHQQQPNNNLNPLQQIALDEIHELKQKKQEQKHFIMHLQQELQIRDHQLQHKEYEKQQLHDALSQYEKQINQLKKENSEQLFSKIAEIEHLKAQNEEMVSHIHKVRFLEKENHQLKQNNTALENDIKQLKQLHLQTNDHPIAPVQGVQPHVPIVSEVDHLAKENQLLKARLQKLENYAYAQGLNQRSLPVYPPSLYH